MAPRQVYDGVRFQHEDRTLREIYSIRIPEAQH